LSLQPDIKRLAVRSYIRRQLYRHRFNLTINVVNVLIRSTLFLIPPILTKYILEVLLPKQNWHLLLLASLCILVVPIVGSAMIVLECVTGRAIVRLTGEGRADLYNGIQYKPLDWLRGRSAGDLMTRIMEDTRQLSDVSGRFLWMLFLLNSIVIGFGLLGYLHPGLGAVVLALWIGHALIMSKTGERLKKNALETAEQTSRLADSVRETVTAAPFIKAAGIEAKALDTIHSCLKQELTFRRKGLLINQAIELMNSSISSLILVVMYGIGGSLTIQGEMTLGSFVAFIAVYQWIRPFGTTLLSTYIGVRATTASVRRVADIAFPVPEQAGAEPDWKPPYSVTAEGVSFSYGGTPVVKRLSCRIEAGSLVHIAGFRGSGKSTLAELLLGLHEPDSGEVRINGTPIRRLSPGWLRRNMLCVTQDIVLRNGTVLDNIGFGCEAADEHRVREAVRIAQLEDWVAALPDGLHTQLGEMAQAVSGGERQRISIARAVVRRPSVLVLDEATSALDAATERRLLAALKELRGETTIVMITHRLESTKEADSILVMQGGEIAESGTYNELAGRPGVFRELLDALDRPMKAAGG
jgi:ATP-binding cassette subfamily B protein